MQEKQASQQRAADALWPSRVPYPRACAPAKLLSLVTKCLTLRVLRRRSTRLVGTRPLLRRSPPAPLGAVPAKLTHLLTTAAAAAAQKAAAGGQGVRGLRLKGTKAFPRSAGSATQRAMRTGRRPGRRAVAQVLPKGACMTLIHVGVLRYPNR